MAPIDDSAERPADRAQTIAGSSRPQGDGIKSPGCRKIGPVHDRARRAPPRAVHDLSARAHRHAREMPPIPRGSFTGPCPSITSSRICAVGACPGVMSGEWGAQRVGAVRRCLSRERGPTAVPCRAARPASQDRDVHRAAALVAPRAGIAPGRQRSRGSPSRSAPMSSGSAAKGSDGAARNRWPRCDGRLHRVEHGETRKLDKPRVPQGELPGPWKGAEAFESPEASSPPVSASAALCRRSWISGSSRRRNSRGRSSADAQMSPSRRSTGSGGPASLSPFPAPSDLAFDHHLLDVGDRLRRVQALGAGPGAVHESCGSGRA